jgi:signal transduction histidine kinase
MHGLFYPNLAVCQPEYSFWYYFLLGAIISLYPSNEHAMNNLFSSLFDLLSNSPGSLIYHLVLVFTIALSLQALLVNRRLTGDSAARRMVVGFLLLLVVQVILFLSTGLAWQGLANPHQFLPPLDRAFTTFSLVWIIWLWAFARRFRLADALVMIASAAIIICFFFTLQGWSAQSLNTPFNTSWYDLGWELSAVVIVLLGMLALFLIRPTQWGLGLAFLTMNLAAHAIQLIYPMQTGDFSGIVRLGQLITFPLLPVLALRWQSGMVVIPQTVVSPMQPKPFTVLPPAQSEATTTRHPFGADTRTLYAMLSLAYQQDPERIPGAIARVVAQVLVADLCFIFAPATKTELIIHAGFDLIREAELPGMAIPQKKVPNLTTALQRGKSLFLANPNDSVPEFKVFCELMGLRELGGMMFVPLLTNRKVVGGMLLLNPYSKRPWNGEDQDYIISATDLVAKILVRASAQLAEPPPETSQKAVIEELNQQIDSAREENERLLAELTELKQSSLAQNHPDIDTLVSLQKDSQTMIESLQKENERLQNLLQTSEAEIHAGGGDLEKLKKEFTIIADENSHLMAAIQELQAKNQKVQDQPELTVGRVSEDDMEVVASIVQELRQPMASIVGYTDLMLSESVGILGALQQKFLERIKSSVERMRVLLDDLIQIISFQANPHPILTEFVEVSSVLDQAVRETSRQLQEKKINLRVDLPETLPRLKADRDAIQQILVQLMQNAATATPIEGSIMLRFAIQISDNMPYLLMEVTDTGGGISPDDQPRVFARRYRADNPLIQGVGDTGVGLSIAKTLVDAHQGRIWVESNQEEGTTTFSALLPILAEEGATSTQK